MKDVVYADDILVLAEQLDIGFITIDQDYNIVKSNPISQSVLGELPGDIKEICPHDFFSEAPCRNCLLGKKSYCILSSDKRHRHIFFVVDKQENYNGSLLRESERLKRVLLDNLNSSFLIIDKQGVVERAHFVGELSLVLGKRAFAEKLDRIFSLDLSEKVLSRIEKTESGGKREMSHFRFDLHDQTLWLDFYFSPIGDGKYFIDIDDKTGEHYLLERLDKLSRIESTCVKIDELGEKTSNLVNGILGYTELAMGKTNDPVVADILDSIRKISSDSVNLLKLMQNYTREKNDLPSRKGDRLVQGESLVLRTAFVDVEKAIENLEGNRELYGTVISDFINDYSDISERLEKLFGENISEAHRLVHSIKGVAGIVGAIALQNEANILEAALRAQKREEAEKMLPSFQEMVDKVIKELKSLDIPGVSDDKPGSTGNVSQLILDSHQKDLLKENLMLAEAGDYNGLMDNLEHYSSFEWGEDWEKAVHSIKESVEMIDFDRVRQYIESLVN
ncbi:MAG: Hpt domain-containing protein [Spirochaetales bacterium]|nr:Hpt domain-containing protein [Spirochaetales bacterium]